MAVFTLTDSSARLETAGLLFRRSSVEFRWVSVFSKAFSSGACRAWPINRAFYCVAVHIVVRASHRIPTNRLVSSWL
jgi:hypothetical protein